jgi:hypothetical protein
MCISSGVMRAPMLMSSSATATRLLLLADCPAIHCAATTTGRERQKQRHTYHRQSTGISHASLIKRIGLSVAAFAFLLLLFGGDAAAPAPAK